MATLESAGPGDLSFLSHPRYRRQLRGTRASAVILARDERDATALPRILCEDPYVYFARAAQLLSAEPRPAPGVHPQAVIEAGAIVPDSATVGAGCRIGREARLGERVIVDSGCSVGDRVAIGEESRLYASVTIYPRCVIGKRAVIHSGAVIGADGFGMAPMTTRPVCGILIQRSPSGAIPKPSAPMETAGSRFRRRGGSSSATTWR